jgi:hypothetical protein
MHRFDQQVRQSPNGAVCNPHALYTIGRPLTCTASTVHKAVTNVLRARTPRSEIVWRCQRIVTAQSRQPLGRSGVQKLKIRLCAFRRHSEAPRMTFMLTNMSKSQYCPLNNPCSLEQLQSLPGQPKLYRNWLPSQWRLDTNFSI